MWGGLQADTVCRMRSRIHLVADSRCFGVLPEQTPHPLRVSQYPMTGPSVFSIMSSMQCGGMDVGEMSLSN